MSVYVPFDDQKKQDATFTIKSMGIQLGINVGTAIIVMIGFSFLRPVCNRIHRNGTIKINQEKLTFLFHCLEK